MSILPRCRYEEGSPPPVVVLVAQCEVDGDDGDLYAPDDEEGSREEEEAKHVNKLVQPDFLHDLEDLDEHHRVERHASKCRQSRQTHHPAPFRFARIENQEASVATSHQRKRERERDEREG